MVFSPCIVARVCFVSISIDTPPVNLLCIQMHSYVRACTRLCLQGNSASWTCASQSEDAFICESMHSHVRACTRLCLQGNSASWTCASQSADAFICESMHAALFAGQQCELDLRKSECVLPTLSRLRAITIAVQDAVLRGVEPPFNL